MKHIMLECKATGQNSKGLMDGNLRSKDSRSDGGIDNIGRFANILQRIAMEDST